MLIGYHGDLGNNYGSVVRVFPNGQPFFKTDTPASVVQDVQNACAPIYSAGQTPFFSVKPNPGDLLGGFLDEHLDAIAQWAEGQPRKPYMTVWHEPENDMSGGQFQQVYGYAANLLRPSVLMGPVNMAYQWQEGVSGLKVTNVADWVIPSSQKDFHGADFYTHTGYSTGKLTDHKAWNRWRTAVGDDSLIFIVERGMDGGDQAAILAYDIAVLETMGAYGYLVWDVNANGHPYVLSGDALSVLSQLAAEPEPTPEPTYTRADVDAAFLSGKQAARDALVASINQTLGL